MIVLIGKVTMSTLICNSIKMCLWNLRLSVRSTIVMHWVTIGKDLCYRWVMAHWCFVVWRLIILCSDWRWVTFVSQIRSWRPAVRTVICRRSDCMGFFGNGAVVSNYARCWCGLLTWRHEKWRSVVLPSTRSCCWAACQTPPSHHTNSVTKDAGVHWFLCHVGSGTKHILKSHFMWFLLSSAWIQT